MKDALKDVIPVGKDTIKQITENRRLNLMSAIWKAMTEEELNDWESGFMDDIYNKLKMKRSLTMKQYDKTLEVLDRVGIGGA